MLKLHMTCLDGWSAVLEAYAKQFNITKLKSLVTELQVSAASIM